jgi:exosortase
MELGTTVSPVAEGDATSVAAKPAAQLPLTAIFWFLALLTVLYFPVLKIMVSEWFTDETMGHALFVPITAAYLIWLDRDRIMAAPVKRCWPALILVVWGFCQMLAGFLGADFFIARTAFLIAVVGIVWTIAGTAVLRTLVFPLFVLLFMIRIPLYVFQQITFPLQLIASKAAAHGLDLLGIPVWREGNVMHVPGRDLEVVEACSGIRSLLSLTFLSVAYGRLFERRVWLRVALFASTIPIAIGCNAFRVTLTGVLTQWKPEIAEGAYHSFEGWVIFVVELMALIAVHRILRFASRSHA